jgi:ABC-type amino acid transport substrate-binding protein
MFCVLVFGLSREVESTEARLTVDIEITAPCVMHNNSTYTGFDIELWEEIAQELNWSFAYNETDLNGIFTDLIEGNADVAFSCITMTKEREEIVDFSHHYLDSGLRIMVLSKTKFSMAESMKSFYSPKVFNTLAYIGVFIIICGHIFWWVERGHKYISTNYLPGIFQAYWYVLVTMTTVGYGDIVPRSWFGRVMAFLVMMIGIGIFGWTIAQLSSVITLQRLHSDITDPLDLRDRLVATVEGTTSVAALEKIGAFVAPAKSIDQAYQKLLRDEVDAVVFDSPTILYYARNEGAGKVSAVGPLFDVQYYGFLFPQGSDLREPVNRALLKLRTNGTYDKLHNKWFGSY